MNRPIAITAFVALAITTVLTNPALAQQTYVLTDIAPRAGGEPTSFGIHINASGAIAGTTEVNGNYLPFVWVPPSSNAPTGTFSYLPVPSGANAGTYATGINNVGQVCGYSVKTTWPKKRVEVVTTTALVWQPNGAFTVLLNGGSAIGASPRSINDAGEVAGDFGLWVNGRVYPLPGRRATSINASGQIAGVFDTSGTGYLWTPATNNGTAGSYVSIPFWASEVNDLGTVAGSPVTMGLPSAAALYSPSTGVQYLMPNNPNGPFANSVNNAGQVVGVSAVAGFPYLWDSTHGLRNLNDTTQFTLTNGGGWSIAWAEGINNYGQIVGWGTNPSGAQRYFLLTPH